MWSRARSWTREQWIRLRQSPIFGWTKKQWLRFVFAAVLGSLLFLLLQYLWKSRSDALYAVTGLAIVWYTVETWGLRWQAIVQTEISKITPNFNRNIRVRLDPFNFGELY